MVQYYGGHSSLRGTLREHLEKINHPKIKKQKANLKKKNTRNAFKQYVKMAQSGQDPTKMHINRSLMKQAKRAKSLVERKNAMGKPSKRITAKQRAARQRNIKIAQRSKRRR